MPRHFSETPPFRNIVKVAWEDDDRYSVIQLMIDRSPTLDWQRTRFKTYGVNSNATVENPFGNSGDFRWVWASQQIFKAGWSGSSWSVCQDLVADPVDFVGGPVIGLPELPIEDSASQFYAHVGNYPYMFMPHARWVLEGDEGAFLDDDLPGITEGAEWVRATSATLELRGKNGGGGGAGLGFIPEGGWIVDDAVIPDDGRPPAFQSKVYGDGPTVGPTIEVSISGITATNEQVTPNVVYKGIGGHVQLGSFHPGGPRRVGILHVLMARADDPEYFP